MPKILVDSNNHQFWQLYVKIALQEFLNFKQSVLTEGLSRSLAKIVNEQQAKREINQLCDYFCQEMFLISGSKNEDFKNYFKDYIAQIIALFARSKEVSKFHLEMVNDLLPLHQAHYIPKTRKLLVNKYVGWFFEEKFLSNKPYLKLDEKRVAGLKEDAARMDSSAQFIIDNYKPLLGFAIAFAIALFCKNKYVINLVTLFSMLVLAKYLQSIPVFDQKALALCRQKTSTLATTFQVLSVQETYQATAIRDHNEAKTNVPAGGTRVGFNYLGPQANTPLNLKKYYQRLPKEPKDNQKAKEVTGNTIVPVANEPEPPPLPHWEEALFCCKKPGPDNIFFFVCLDIETLESDKQGRELTASLIGGFNRGFQKKHIPGIVWDSDHQILKIIPTTSTGLRGVASIIRMYEEKDKIYQLFIIDSVCDTHTRNPAITIQDDDKTPIPVYRAV